MTQDSWTDRLSSYLDDDLAPGERLELERHLLDCRTCRTTLEELRAVVTAAHSLEHDGPARDLWPGIATRLPIPSTRHVRVPLFGAIAAGILLALTSTTTAWLLVHRPAPAAEVTTSAEQPIVARPVSVGTVPYGHAIDDLMTTLDSRRDQLNPRTVQVLERSLATIDQAIADAVAVLRDHPDDLALVQRITEQRRMKLAVLRQVERLTVAPEQ